MALSLEFAFISLIGLNFLLIKNCICKSLAKKPQKKLDINETIINKFERLIISSADLNTNKKIIPIKEYNQSFLNIPHAGPKINATNEKPVSITCNPSFELSFFNIQNVNIKRSGNYKDPLVEGTSSDRRPSIVTA